MKSNRGFSHVVVLPILVLVTIAATGIAVLQRSQNTKAAQSSINTYGACVKAGYPTKQSNPVSCVANGKSFAKPDQSTQIQPENTSTQTTPPASMPTGSATLTGVVTYGPTTPTCSSGSASCSTVLADYTVVAINSSGDIIASAKTNNVGRYSMTLALGRYTLNLDPKYMTLKDNQIDLKSGVNTLNLNGDSRIR